MTENRLTVLRREDLDALALTWDEIIEVLGAAFTQKAASQVQNPPKPRVAPREDAFANAMPAYLSGSDRLGLKWVSGYQGNPTAGHPYIYGSLMMNDAATGRPMALIDGSWVTEMRTAAVSGLVMRHVEGARTVAMVGCGTQGRRHAELAMEALPDLDLVRAYDRVPAAVDRLTEVVGGRPVHRATSPQDAVEGADLVISSLTEPLPSKLVADGTSSSAVFLPIDYDDAVSAQVVAGASLYLVDDRTQYASARTRAFHDFREPDGELAELVTGQRALPRGERSVVMNMGLAMADVALGGLVVDRAAELGAGDLVRFP
jgi:ornithine cyclodeaminase/alanine dehydrogenase-like protein (mu-crystallin family)